MRILFELESYIVYQDSFTEFDTGISDIRPMCTDLYFFDALYKNLRER